ncbi:MAG: hypothetical protein WD423_02300 [Rhodothermales bacterium]
MTDDTLTYASDYTSEQLERSKNTLLHAATFLGDFARDVVLVGGLVPVFLIAQEVDGSKESHVGSVDVDLVLSLSMISQQRYQLLAERLRAQDFLPDTNEKGNETKQRWRYREPEKAVTLDFLIDESDTEDHGWGRIHSLTDDLGAIRAFGARLAFEDVNVVEIIGRTLEGDAASREIQVCGPAAFVVLKAIAFSNRKARKDAYDMGYVLRYYGQSTEDVAARFKIIEDHPATKLAIEILRNDFSSEEAMGPRDASRFLFQTVNDEYVAEYVGSVRRLLKLIG